MLVGLEAFHLPAESVEMLVGLEAFHPPAESVVLLER